MGLWLTTSSPIECRSNLASELLWDALDGDGEVQRATKIVRGMPGRRIDDTTVVIIFSYEKSYRMFHFLAPYWLHTNVFIISLKKKSLTLASTGTSTGLHCSFSASALVSLSISAIKFTILAPAGQSTLAGNCTLADVIWPVGVHRENIMIQVELRLRI